MSSSRGVGAAAAVRAVAARAASGLPDAVVVVEELVELRRLADVAEAGFLARLRVFDARGLGEDDGLSTRAWLADRLHVAPGEASRMLKLARGLDHLPETSTALVEGAIRVPHAAAMVDAATLLGTDIVAEAETVLVEAARVEEPSRLRAALRGYGAAIDHPRAVKDAERRDEGRWLDLATTLDGVVSISGILGPEDGTLVKTAVQTLTRPAGPDDARSATQRRADALTELARRQLNTGHSPAQVVNHPTSPSPPPCTPCSPAATPALATSTPAAAAALPATTPAALTTITATAPPRRARGSVSYPTGPSCPDTPCGGSPATRRSPG